MPRLSAVGIPRLQAGEDVKRAGRFCPDGGRRARSAVVTAMGLVPGRASFPIFGAMAFCRLAAHRLRVDAPAVSGIA